MKKSFITLFLFTFVLSSNTFGQISSFQPLTGDFTFKPDWESKRTFLMVNVNTKLQTNIKDVPISFITDSLFVEMNVTPLKESGGWHIALIHYTEFDFKTKKGKNIPTQFNRRFPIELEFDSSTQFLGIPNWEWWRDQHLNNLAKEAASGKIDSATYNKFFNLYIQRDYLEKTVLGSYQDYFSLFGRTITLWHEHPVMRAIETPYSFELIEKAGTEKAYDPEESPSLIYHFSETKTNEDEYEMLAEAFINNIKNLTQEQKAGYPLPRIFIKEKTFHSYDKNQNVFLNFRFEKEINNNGAKLLEEDFLKLILFKD
jgi:hypothetical protein